MALKVKKQLRISEEMEYKLEYICSTIGMEVPNAMREAISEWINKKQWEIDPAEKIRKFLK